MNIIQMHKEERRRKILIIRQGVLKAFNKNLDVDFKKLIGVCCRDFGCSRRHILELIDIALSDVTYKITKIDGVKKICQK